MNKFTDMKYITHKNKDYYYKSKLRFYFWLVKMNIKDFNAHGHRPHFYPGAMTYKEISVMKHDLDVLINSFSATLNFLQYLRNQL